MGVWILTVVITLSSNGITSQSMLYPTIDACTTALEAHKKEIGSLGIHVRGVCTYSETRPYR